MNRERLMRPIQEFTSRPFDKAASKLVYQASWYLPISSTLGHLLFTFPQTLFELRPPQHLALATAEVAFIWFMAGKIRSRVINEATRHRFILTDSQKETIDKGPKPPSAGGGAF